MESPNIYFDLTIMSNAFNFTLFAFPSFVFLDIRFTSELSAIVFFDKRLFFKRK